MTWEERKELEKKRLSQIYLRNRFVQKPFLKKCCPESVRQGEEGEAQADGGGQGEGEAGVEEEGTDKVACGKELCAFLQYNLDKPESVEEPVEESEEEEEEEEEETESIRKDDTEDEDHLDELARKYENIFH